MKQLIAKKSMERDMAEAIGLHGLGFALCASSSFKLRGHDRVTLGHDVGGGDGWERPVGRDHNEWCDV